MVLLDGVQDHVAHAAGIAATQTCLEDEKKNLFQVQFFHFRKLYAVIIHLQQTVHYWKIQTDGCINSNIVCLNIASRF